MSTLPSWVGRLIHGPMTASLPVCGFRGTLSILQRVRTSKKDVTRHIHLIMDFTASGICHSSRKSTKPCVFKMKCVSSITCNQCVPPGRWSGCSWPECVSPAEVQGALSLTEGTFLVSFLHHPNYSLLSLFIIRYRRSSVELFLIWGCVGSSGLQSHR